MSARNTSLLRLQESLLQTGAGNVQSDLPTLLPFEAAGGHWSVPCDEVARVLMPGDVISLQGYAQLPECVVGAVAGDSEMLSVVDAGLLLGRAPAHASLKSRLIVFNDGPLKGVALLVDRVMARLPAHQDKAADGISHIDATILNTRLQAKSSTRIQAA